MAETNKPWPGPPAGVSTTDGEGGHVPVAEKPAPVRSKGRRRQVGEDILKNLDDFKLIKGGNNNPVGTTATRIDIREGKMPKTRRARRHMATFTSVDGTDYSFRTHDNKGKAVTWRPQLMLFAAMRELLLGGSPAKVVDAFGFTLNDAQNQQFWPPTEESLSHVRALAEAGTLGGSFEDDDADEDGFSLGSEG